MIETIDTELVSTDFNQIEVGDQVVIIIEDVDIDGNSNGDLIEVKAGVAEVDLDRHKVVVKCGNYKNIDPYDFRGISSKGEYL